MLAVIVEHRDADAGAGRLIPGTRCIDATVPVPLCRFHIAWFAMAGALVLEDRALARVDQVVGADIVLLRRS